ncbi:MAG: catalase family peroxidase [Gallionella sp.]|jgi:catalase|nr:catalase family peroxidase [Gallionella sp.]MCK9353114.1 catalase family peroxidase [Gallionella sp.]
MRNNKLPEFLSGWLFAGALALGASPAIAVAQEATAEQAVEAIEEVFGVTQGQRRNHTKGACALGEFIGTKEAATYSRSPLFSGQKLPVVARFSLAGGNPNAPDTAKTPRGMALEFALPDSGPQHITMLNTPMFGAAQPETFVAQMIAMKPDPATGKPDPKKIKEFRDSHPDNRAQAEFLASHNPPASYASSAYFGIHTFKFIDDDGKVTPVRWRFVPQDGEKRLTDAELKTMPPDFLERRLVERAKKGKLRWDMIVTIGKPGDPEDNPTLTWPEGHKQIKAGTLTISSTMPQQGAACEYVNFDPLIMGDGIEPSNDPILLFRSPAYAVSFAKRISGM